jgi:hypothetical protein
MPGTAAQPSRQTIESWIAGEEANLQDIKDRLKPLVEQERQTVDRLAGLKSLLILYSGEPDINVSPEILSQSILSVSTPAVGQRRLQSVGDKVRAQVREILAASAEPMHINDIHQQFLNRGWTVPGAGTPANITAHLPASRDIVSPSRGIYSLQEAAREPKESQLKQPEQRRTARTSKQKRA